MNVVYKYFSSCRNFFEDRLIRFTPRSALNDPFEVRPSTEGLVRYIYRNRSSPNESLASVEEEVLRRQDRYFTKDNSAIPFLNELGILSLTECKSNLLMWSHYANEHKGYVVGFDPSHEFFRRKVQSSHLSHINGLGELLPVRYDSHRGVDPDSYIDWFFQKSNEWIYEKEHRIVTSLECCDVLKQWCKKSKKHKVIGNRPTTWANYGPSYLCLFEIPPEAIVSITYGAQIENEFRQSIENTIEQQGLALRKEKANISTSRFELNFELLR